MDTVFTIQWPEFQLANRLQKMLKKKDGYSIYIPLSRQEKGVDLVLLKKSINGGSRALTIQVKASRVYMSKPPKNPGKTYFRFNTWFNRFVVQPEADLYLLYGTYAPDPNRTLKVGAKWYQDSTLMFTNEEMKIFIDSCLTVKEKPDGKFGFGFDDNTKIYQTRRDRDKQLKDYPQHLLEKRLERIAEMLE